MPLVVVGISHKSAPVAVLERAVVAEQNLPKALDDLIARPNLNEVMLLATCQRTEIYVEADKFHPALDDIFDWISNQTGVVVDHLPELCYSHYDEKAVEHLFRVACGLESAVLGETEVLGQLKAAHAAASELGITGPTIDRAVIDALIVGRKARNATGIARGTTSLSRAAVELAIEHIGSLDSKRVCVVGAGQMGTGVARNLRDVSASVELSVVNRTSERAAIIAEPIGAAVMRLGELLNEMAKVDLVVMTLATDIGLVDADDLQQVMQQRNGRHLLIVDLGLPRNVVANPGEVEGIELVQLEQLSEFAESAFVERQSEVPKVESIVADALTRHLGVGTELQMAPVITQLRDQAESIRSGELQKTTKKVGDFSPQQLEAIEVMTQAIVNKLLHQPTATLRSAAGTKNAEVLVRALQELYGIEDQ